MTERVAESLALRPHHRILDVGCGTGLYARQLVRAVRPVKPVLCADPSAAMLDRVEPTAGIHPVLASAEQLGSVRTGTVRPRVRPRSIDAILLKEVIHHVAPADREQTITGLSRLLVNDGRLLIIMLPTQIRYPLFNEALRRFEELQPDPEEIAAYVRRAGLSAGIEYREFALTVPKERYLEMVRGRYMSILSTFDAAEIDAGIGEIDLAHPESMLSFPDRFAFVIGTRPPMR
ncbi:class I SAM-dependent methyltransferase [Frankia sp. AgKG'84/4]|uniref:class I SAM-dependent methyltransferase n=1 Tax=Frankia sp. AgKG'84/4 TaxID=573490 RepID=UPI00200E26FC|nr:class I SAM-dependent methyltransferase [Frankia sp. AgKG'84/4]MCL9793093.1 class I SAM-dependent methyltransferase [Frankia sp. AgKG'84/4]